MNNNIQESYCSFEVSKLLKEKGLDCGTHKTAYSEDGTRSISPYSSFYDPYKYPILDCTHSVAIEWIRVNFGIWIQAATHEVDKWCYHTQKTTAGTISPKICEDGQFGLEDFDSPQEAIEAALLYVLQNLTL